MVTKYGFGKTVDLSFDAAVGGGIAGSLTAAAEPAPAGPDFFLTGGAENLNV